MNNAANDLVLSFAKEPRIVFEHVKTNLKNTRRHTLYIGRHSIPLRMRLFEYPFSIVWKMSVHRWSFKKGYCKAKRYQTGICSPIRLQRKNVCFFVWELVIGMFI